MPSSRPNIVFILADDMGYGDFGCFNGGISQTPAQIFAQAVQASTRLIRLGCQPESLAYMGGTIRRQSGREYK